MSKSVYRSWPKARRLAFLVNAYHAWTIDLLLGRHPDLKSIKDLGSVFQSPWKRKFFILETAVAGVQNG